MAEPINLELRARHLQAIRADLRDMQFHAENDRRNIRSQFDNLAATHASQLGDVEAKMAARLDALETLVGDRLGYLDERIGSLEERLGALEQRFGVMDDRISRLEAHAAHNAQQMDRLMVLVERLVQDR
jgi:chromosome segregation ATPase